MVAQVSFDSKQDEIKYRHRLRNTISVFTDLGYVNCPIILENRLATRSEKYHEYRIRIPDNLIEPLRIALSKFNLLIVECVSSDELPLKYIYFKDNNVRNIKTL